MRLATPEPDFQEKKREKGGKESKGTGKKERERGERKPRRERRETGRLYSKFPLFQVVSVSSKGGIWTKGGV